MIIVEVYSTRHVHDASGGDGWAEIFLDVSVQTLRPHRRVGGGGLAV